MLTILLFLFFLAPTVQYRMQLGSVTISLMEPVVLIASIFLFLREYFLKHSISLPRNRIFQSLYMMLFWVFFTQIIFSKNTMEGLSDLRNWFIPILGFVALLSVKKDWRKWIGIYIFITFLNSLLGIYQYVTDSFRPFQNTYGDTRLSIVFLNGGISYINTKFSIGLFAHPNTYAMYLLGGFMIALGLALSTRKIKDQIIIIPIATAIILSYSKTSIIMLAVLLLIFGFVWLRVKTSLLSWLYLPAIILLLIGVLYGISSLPAEIFTTYYWRVGLWKIAYEFFLQNPTVMLIGGGLNKFGDLAYYGQPHNLFVYFFLLYGLPGLIILLSILWESIRSMIFYFQTNKAKDKMMEAGLFMASVSLFAVGLTDSTLFGVENRMIFVTWLALFVGFVREIKMEFDHAK